MRNKFLLISLIIALSLTIFFCRSGEKPEPASGDNPGQVSSSLTDSADRGQPHRFRFRHGQGAMKEMVTLSEKEKEVVRIETAKVSHRNIQTVIKAMGKIIAPNNRLFLVSYAFPARVSQIIVKNGDWVNKGSPLIILQSDEVGKSRAEFFRARADLELALANFERQKRLYEQGAGAQKDFIAAEAELKVARASLEACEKKLHLLGFTEEVIEQMSETHQLNPVITIFSPLKGKVIDIRVVPGEMVDQSKDMMIILDPRVLWVDAEIFEKDISRVRPGQKVEISVPAYPDRIFAGKISYVGDILKEETRTVTVRTEVENSELLLKPGMFSSLKIHLNGDQMVLAIPEEAVCDQQGEKFVFVPRGDGFELKKIILGSKHDGFYEVVSGLAEGELVVTTGSYQLKSKLLEKILKEAIHD